MSNEPDELADIFRADRDDLALTVHMNGSGITVRQARDIAAAVIAAGYRKPPVIDTDKLLISDGLLLLAVNYCTCGAGNPEHESHCGFELLEDLTDVLAESGYRKDEPGPYDPLWRLYGKDRGWM